MPTILYIIIITFLEKFFPSDNPIFNIYIYIDTWYKNVIRFKVNAL